MLPDLISSVGSLITSIGALIASLSAARKARQANENTRALTQATNVIKDEVSPNHGSSMKDSLMRIERQLNSQGHQIGEIRKDSAIVHDIFGNQIADLSKRILRLED